ncbi:hypothetical protein HBI56_112750 [Parastagonospora nodorum]|nr:hypothetical protein HBH52_145190 [Parastagonospora nodorum]KAH3980742.1 hypothetical protein HBH51_051130 [Parastagonospora nodorum]KAH4055446.1 hypothetical protein HBH49_059380 [Parastagonospora nodorum]KAH4102172.1 hypothetical protein HBH46_131810 [Parastagonospora nodorum]KAH4176624.1 hypothetical protein HBH43_061410 [Parastagonospora nodorum]
MSCHPRNSHASSSNPPDHPFARQEHDVSCQSTRISMSTLRAGISMLASRLAAGWDVYCISRKDAGSRLCGCKESRSRVMTTLFREEAYIGEIPTSEDGITRVTVEGTPETWPIGAPSLSNTANEEVE